MDKTIAGVLGAVGTIVATASGHAAPAETLHVNSYADLLRPVPNAAQVLAALDAQPAPESAVEQVQYYYPAPYPAYHHHHHHHHRYYRRYYHHHHHHHHHGYYRPYWER